MSSPQRPESVRTWEQATLAPNIMGFTVCNNSANFGAFSLQDENDISPTVVVQDTFSFSENLTSEGLPFDEDRNMYELFTISAEDGDNSTEFGKDSVE